MTVQTTEIDEENIETIGAFLKQVRMKKGLSLVKVAEDLRIRKLYIKAIEDGNTKDLAPVPYGVGFVRSYAAYLGLNVDRIVQIYKEENGQEDEKTELFVPQSEITYPTKRYIFAGVVAALFVYLTAALFFGLKNSNTEIENLPLVEDENAFAEDKSATVENTVAEEPSTEQQEENIEQEQNQEENVSEQKPSQIKEDEQIKFKEDVFVDNTPKTIAKREGVRAVVRIKGETWLEIKDAEQVYVSKIVNEGFEYEIPNKPGIIVSIGRYYNADVYIDGKLTTIATKRKQTNISLDKYLSETSH